MKWVLVLLALSLLIIPASAGTFADAQLSASRINTALQTVTPYDRTLTMTNLAQLGYDTENMTRPGTYRILIKSASYDSEKGLLTLNMWAWHNGASLQTHSPWHFYMPMDIEGTTNLQRLNTFAKMLISNLELLPYGDPIGDDFATIYPSEDARVTEVTDSDFPTMRDAAGDEVSDTAGAGVRLTATNTADIYTYNTRSVFSFNVSGVTGSGATIDAAIFREYKWGSTFSLGWDGYIGIYDGVLANNLSPVAGDYDGFGATSLASAVVCPGSTGNMNYTFNANGLTYIEDNLDSGEYVIIFGLSSFDYGGDTPVWASLAYSKCDWTFVEDPTPENRPYLFITYTPGASAPTCNFTADDTDICTGTTVQYTDTSTNTPTNWDWYNETTKFSDLEDPTLQYNVAGTWDTKLYCSNAGGGDWENKTNYISVDASVTSAFSGSDLDACTGQNITFTDSSTGTEESYIWDFNCDGSDNTTQNAYYTWSTAGSKNVCHYVDNSGCTGDWENKTNMVSVDAAVTANYTVNETPVCTYEYVLFESTSTNAETWDWIFSDSTDCHTEDCTKSFDTAGNIWANLTADNSGCASNSKNQTLLHVDANVTADFTANQTSCTCPCTVAFTDTSTGGTVDDWAWDVDGDAVTEYTTQNAVHTYNAVGLYTVNLTVQNDGCSEFPDTESKVDYINVSGVCPTPTTTRPPTTVQTTVPGMYSPDTCGTCCEDGTSGQVWLAALMVIGVVVVFGVTRK